jgi:hypothetical protein
MAMGKNYTVGIWDITYYLVDEDGNPLLNEDGSVKEFYSNKVETGYFADSIDPDDLKEIDNE